MRIAIPQQSDEVVKVFEESMSLRIYDVENRIIVAMNDMEVDCNDTERLVASLLREKVNGIICGEIGEDSCNALIEAGIAIYSGAEGTPDKAMNMLLNGDITSQDGEFETQGELIYEGKNAGKVVKVHYKGTFNDGSIFDSSYDRGEPLEFACGYGLMIEGFERAVIDLDEGDCVSVHLTPAEAYGEYNPAAVITYPISSLPGLESLEIGQQVSSSVMGQTTIMTVIAKDTETITFDSNHDMAGKELNFEIELVGVR